MSTEVQSTTSSQHDAKLPVSGCGSPRLISIVTDNVYDAVLLAARNGKLKKELKQILFGALNGMYDAGYRQGCKDVAQP